MADTKVDPTRPGVRVDFSRKRQTAPPRTPFREVLATGVNVVMTGAEAATSVVGGPLLAAAVRGGRERAVAAAAGERVAGGQFTDGTLEAPGGELTKLATMQRESQALNMQLLALQEEVQQENRRFSTLTNVLRARHDTAKAALGNIRS